MLARLHGYKVHKIIMQHIQLYLNLDLHGVGGNPNTELDYSMGLCMIV